MLITTANDLPGWEVTDTLGEVFGLTVRSRNVGSQIGAGFKSLMGGELKGMTKALVDSREQVIARMVEEARNRGANAVVAMRFDTSEMGDTWTEICAYGTAVVAVPVTDAAKETAQRLGYGQAAAPQQPAMADPYGGGQPTQKSEPPRPVTGWMARWSHDCGQPRQRRPQGQDARGPGPQERQG